MRSGDPCWTAGDVNVAAPVMAAMIVDEARVRRCLELAAAAVP